MQILGQNTSLFQTLVAWHMIEQRMATHTQIEHDRTIKKKNNLEPAERVNKYIQYLPKPGARKEYMVNPSPKHLQAQLDTVVSRYVDISNYIIIICILWFIIILFYVVSMLSPFHWFCWHRFWPSRFYLPKAHSSYQSCNDNCNDKCLRWWICGYLWYVEVHLEHLAVRTWGKANIKRGHICSSPDCLRACQSFWEISCSTYNIRPLKRHLRHQVIRVLRTHIPLLVPSRVHIISH